MPKPKAGSKSQPQARAFFKKPAVQYITAFLAAYVAFFIAGFIASRVPVFQFLPAVSSTDNTSPYWIAYNIRMIGTQSLLPAILFGAGFWLFGRILIALGVTPLRPSVLWFKALVPAFLFLVFVMSTSLLSALGFLYLSPNAQVIFDLVTIPLLGLMYVAGWWIARH